MTGVHRRKRGVSDLDWRTCGASYAGSINIFKPITFQTATLPPARPTRFTACVAWCSWRTHEFAKTLHRSRLPVDGPAHGAQSTSRVCGATAAAAGDGDAGRGADLRSVPRVDHKHDLPRA